MEVSINLCQLELGLWAQLFESRLTLIQEMFKWKPTGDLTGIKVHPNRAPLYIRHESFKLGFQTSVVCFYFCISSREVADGNFIEPFRETTRNHGFLGPEKVQIKHERKKRGERGKTTPHYVFILATLEILNEKQNIHTAFSKKHAWLERTSLQNPGQDRTPVSYL